MLKELSRLDLRPGSVTWLVGAGALPDATLALAERRNVYLVAFEPDDTLAEAFAVYHANNPRVMLHHIGLADSFEDGPPRIADVAMFVQGSDRLELGLFNCSGAEWRILNRLADLRLLTCFKYLMVQFHSPSLKNWSPPDGTTRRDIIERIDRTHIRVWDSYPAWVLWERR